MDLNQRHKIGGKSPNLLPVTKMSTETGQVSGRFNGFSVSVDNPRDIETIIKMGSFGRATLSRNNDVFKEKNPKFVRNRQFRRRKHWLETLEINSNLKNSILVVPDSESEEDDYSTSFKPVYQLDGDLIKELGNLSLEEAFFLSQEIKCLKIYDNSQKRFAECDPNSAECKPNFAECKPYSAKLLWELFRECDGYFVQNYLVYHHFRSKNWIVKPGVKYGGDFLLYKGGPSLCHAAYVVVVDVLDLNTLERKENLCRRSMNVVQLVNLQRICETAGKELLICEILSPDDMQAVAFDEMPRFSINDILFRRWKSSKKTT